MFNLRTVLANYWLLILTIALMAVIVLTHTNQMLFYKINALHVYLPNQVWNSLNLLAYSRFFILPTLLVVLAFVAKRDKLPNVLLVIVAYYVLFYSLKFVIGEARPYMVLDQHTFFWLNRFENAVHSAYRSFPSGHSGNMAVFVFSVITLFFEKSKWAKALLIGLLALTMLARICTGWHWPLDVLTSSVLGFFLVKVCFAVRFGRSKGQKNKRFTKA